MRLIVILRAAALVACAGLLSACPKKDPDVGAEPAAGNAAKPADTSDKAGAETPAPPPKKKDDQGGW
jgi:type IV pilus biogenesis protein CpaD/CtpE